MNIDNHTPPALPDEAPADENAPFALTGPAASALAEINKLFATNVTADQMAETLRKSLQFDADGESMLFVQAHLLDTLFHRLLVQTFETPDIYENPVPGYLSLDRLQIALRIQKQARSALHALNSLRIYKKMTTGL